MSVTRTAHAGVLDHLFRLHKWPQGFDKAGKWSILATQLILNITAQHASNARDQGIQREEHTRNFLAVPG